MLIELQNFIKEIREKIILPEKNALIETRIILKKHHQLSQLEIVKERITFLTGQDNKCNNFLRFFRHYLDLKKGDKSNATTTPS